MIDHTAAVVTMRDETDLIVHIFYVSNEWFTSMDQFEIEDTIHFHYQERCHLDDHEMFPTRINGYFKDKEGFEILEINYIDAPILKLSGTSTNL